MPGGGTSVLSRGRRFGFSAGIGLDAELIRRVEALGRTSEGRRGDVTEALFETERDAVAVSRPCASSRSGRATRPR